MHSRLTTGFIEASPAGFAVDGDMFSHCGEPTRQQCVPRPKNCYKRFWIDGSEYLEENFLAGVACGVGKSPERHSLFASPQACMASASSQPQTAAINATTRTSISGKRCPCRRPESGSSRRTSLKNSRACCSLLCSIASAWLIWGLGWVSCRISRSVRGCRSRSRPRHQHNHRAKQAKLEVDRPGHHSQTTCPDGSV